MDKEMLNKIKEAADKDLAKQREYDKAYDRKAGFIAGAKWMLELLNPPTPAAISPNTSNGLTREMLVITPNGVGQRCNTCPLHKSRNKNCGGIYENPLVKAIDAEFDVDGNSLFCNYYSITLKDPK